MRFSSSHQLVRSDWSERKNRDIFGGCANIHGHNYDLEVTVKGMPDPETGMIINLHILREVINREIIDWVDHKHFNTDIAEFKDTLPTIENIIQVFWKKLDNALPDGILYKLTLCETETSKVEMCRD